MTQANWVAKTLQSICMVDAAIFPNCRARGGRRGFCRGIIKCRPRQGRPTSPYEWVELLFHDWSLAKPDKRSSQPASSSSVLFDSKPLSQVPCDSSNFVFVK